MLCASLLVTHSEHAVPEFLAHLLGLASVHQNTTCSLLGFPSSGSPVPQPWVFPGTSHDAADPRLMRSTPISLSQPHSEQPSLGTAVSSLDGDCSVPHCENASR